MNEPASCDFLKEKYKTLRKQSEKCEHLIVTDGVFGESFIDAFRVFEEKKQELSGLLKERKKYFSFLWNSATLPENFTFPERIEGDLDLQNLTALPEGIIFPKYIGGNLDLRRLTDIPEGTVFPEHIGHDLEFYRLTALPEGVLFPKHIGNGLYIRNLIALPEDFSFPEHIGNGAILNRKLKDHPSVTTIPDSTLINWSDTWI